MGETTKTYELVLYWIFVAIFSVVYPYFLYAAIKHHLIPIYTNGLRISIKAYVDGYDLETFQKYETLRNLKSKHVREATRFEDLHKEDGSDE